MDLNSKKAELDQQYQMALQDVQRAQAQLYRLEGAIALANQLIAEQAETPQVKEQENA